jgi:hypothetical protein
MGLKGLLHMLNAIVSPMKANLCYLCFSFCFAKGLTKFKFGVFDQCQILIFDPLNLCLLDS